MAAVVEPEHVFNNNSGKAEARSSVFDGGGRWRGSLSVGGCSAWRSIDAAAVFDGRREYSNSMRRKLDNVLPYDGLKAGDSPAIVPRRQLMDVGYCALAHGL